MTTQQDVRKDMRFLREIIADLKKYGYVQGGKAPTMLDDWYDELKKLAVVPSKK